MTAMDVSSLSPNELREQSLGDAPPVLLDVREEGVFGQGHLFYASCAPLSTLEFHIGRLVPRRSTSLVVMDGGEDGDDLARRAGERLGGFGYDRLAVLKGGVTAWREAGFEVFSGLNVPSKAFGEFVEHTYGTPSLTPRQLREKMDGGQPMIIVDSRPLEEYTRMNIPGGINVPGAELVYRIHDLIPSPETLVVVNCAGRTRSIIGAQSLINAGLRNPVTDLMNGTMGWHLAGFELEHGQTRIPGAPSGQGLQKAREAAARVARRFGVRTVDAATFAAWRSEADRRTLYVYDVRVPEEYQAGHLAGARNAPGGQLVQATDTYLADRTARVVLTDRDGVRATLTASWLIQMNWREVYVLEDRPADAPLETGAFSEELPGMDEVSPETITPAALAALLQPGSSPSGVVVVDFASSPVYRRGHIPGAWFAVRARLAEALPKLPDGRPLVLTSPDGLLARLAAPEVKALGVENLRVLQGGTAAWRAGGHSLTEGEEALACATDDVFPKPYDHPGGVEQRMKDYLSWEVELMEQVRRSGEAAFREYPPLEPSP